MPNVDKIMLKEEYYSYKEFMKRAKMEYIKLLLDRTGGDMLRMIEISKISRAQFYRIVNEVGGLPVIHSVQGEHLYRSNFSPKGPQRNKLREEDEY